MSRISTVEALREAYARKIPLFHVEYLPYLDFFDAHPERRPRGYGYGRLDDIYTTREEAERRFNALARSGLVETIDLYHTTYPRDGGRARRLLDEWKDPPRDTSERDRGRRRRARGYRR